MPSRQLAALARVAFLLLLALVTVLALVPDVGGTNIQGADKVKHALAFAALGCTGWLAFSRRLWLVIGLVAYGVAIEFAQALPIVGKDASAADVIADAVGMLLGFGAALLVARLNGGLVSRRTSPLRL